MDDTTGITGRKFSVTQRLAYRFVTELLGRKWNYAFGVRHITDAKKLVKDGELDPDCILAAIKLAQMGVLDYNGKIESMWVVTYGTPTLYDQYIEWVRKPPPFYNKVAVDFWEKTTGKVAYPKETDIIIVAAPVAPIALDTPYERYR